MLVEDQFSSNHTQKVPGLDQSKEHINEFVIVQLFRTPLRPLIHSSVVQVGFSSQGPGVTWKAPSTTMPLDLE